MSIEILAKFNKILAKSVKFTTHKKKFDKEIGKILVIFRNFSQNWKKIKDKRKEHLVSCDETRFQFIQKMGCVEFSSDSFRIMGDVINYIHL